MEVRRRARRVPRGPDLPQRVAGGHARAVLDELPVEVGVVERDRRVVGAEPHHEPADGRLLNARHPARRRGHDGRPPLGEDVDALVAPGAPVAGGAPPAADGPFSDAGHRERERGGRLDPDGDGPLGQELGHEADDDGLVALGPALDAEGVHRGGPPAQPHRRRVTGEQVEEHGRRVGQRRGDRHAEHLAPAEVDPPAGGGRGPGLDGDLVLGREVRRGGLSDGAVGRAGPGPPEPGRVEAGLAEGVGVAFGGGEGRGERVGDRRASGDPGHEPDEESETHRARTGPTAGRSGGRAWPRVGQRPIGLL